MALPEATRRLILLTTLCESLEGVIIRRGGRLSFRGGVSLPLAPLNTGKEVSD